MGILERLGFRDNDMGFARWMGKNFHAYLTPEMIERYSTDPDTVPPRRAIVLALALAMGCSREEIAMLLDAGGYEPLRLTEDVRISTDSHVVVRLAALMPRMSLPHRLYVETMIDNMMDWVTEELGLRPIR